MKVLIYSRSFAPQAGGIESLLLLLARKLAGPNSLAGAVPINVVVATSTPRESFQDASLPYRVVRRPGLLNLVQLIRSADIVHVAGPAILPLALGAALRKPVVVEHHGFQAVCPNGLLHYEPARSVCPGHFMAGRHRECLRCNGKYGRLRSLKMWALTFMRRWLCRCVAKNIAPTVWVSQALRLPRTTTILHGVENCAAASLGVPAKPPAFVFVGRLVSTKGVHILLQATHSLKETGLGFRVEIVGDGPERLNLEMQSRDLQLSNVVTFRGYLPPEDLERTLAEAIATVMPSLGGEVFGLVAAESMMRGRLVIVSDIGPLAEVIGVAGLKFRPGDAKALASCMERILRAPEEARRMGQYARERARREFSVSGMLERHVRVYGQALAGQR